MSRLGKIPVDIPAGVTAVVDINSVTVKGPKGVLSLRSDPSIRVVKTDNSISVNPVGNSKHGRAMFGTTRAHIKNMMKGITEGFEKNLELVGVGYRAQVQGRDVKLTLGFSHEVIYKPREGITLTVPKPTELKIIGPDAQSVGQTAAEIRRLRPPEPYKGKGLKYAGEHIRRKDGKKK